MQGILAWGCAWHSTVAMVNNGPPRTLTRTFLHDLTTESPLIRSLLITAPRLLQKVHTLVVADE